MRAGAFLSYLTAADRQYVLDQGIRQSFGPGEVLLHEGGPSDHLFVLVSGWAQFYPAAPHRDSGCQTGARGRRGLLPSNRRDFTSLMRDVKFSGEEVLSTPPGNSESRQR